MKTYETIISDKPAAIGRTPIIHNDIVYALTQKSNIFICDVKDFDLVKDRRLSEDKQGYVRFGHNIRLQKLLRERLGVLPENKLYLDHINRIKLDNRRCNLRTVTHQQNVQNQLHHKEKNEYIGVKVAHKSHQNPLYQTYIRVNNEYLFPGTYHTEEEAAYARDRAAVFHHGEYAVLNFPENLPKYKEELLNGVPWQKKRYAKGVVTHPMKYIHFCNTWKKWVVNDLNSQQVFRSKVLEEVIAFRDTYYSSLRLDTTPSEKPPAGKEMYCKTSAPEPPSE